MTVFQTRMPAHHYDASLPTAADQLSDLELPKLINLKDKTGFEPDLAFVQERIGNFPTPPQQQGNPVPPINAANPVPQTQDPKADAVAAIRAKYFTVLEKAILDCSHNTTPLLADLALGRPGAYREHEKKRSDAAEALEEKFAKLNLPQFKKLTTAQNEILDALKINNGQPEIDPKVIAHFKTKLLEAAELKTSDGLTAFPDSGWTADTVKDITRYLKHDAVWMHVAKKEYLYGIGMNAFGEKGEPWSISSEIHPTQAARIQRYLKNKHGDDPKILEKTRDDDWEDYRTGTSGAGTAGRIEREFPQEPIINALEAYKTFNTHDKALYDAQLLTHARQGQIQALLANKEAKDDLLVEIRQHIANRENILREAIQTANNELKSIGASPITDADVSRHFAAKNPRK